MIGIKVDDELVRKVADLAQLSLSDQEISFYQERLSKILHYMEQLDQVQDDSEPAAAAWRSDTERGQGYEASTPERPDEVGVSLDVEEVMKQAPARMGSSFQVPRIIE